MCEFCDLERSMADVAAAEHRAGTEWFWTELRVLQLHWDVLSHPFYTRWSAGEQRRHELNGSC